MTTRVIVDENVGDGSPIWEQFRQAMGSRKYHFVFLKEAHRGIPDVEILDKLLHPDTILLTGDRVLHMRVIERGFRSYTLNEQGQLTRRRLRGIRPLKSMPQSTEKALRNDYYHQPKNEISSSLKSTLTERQLKRYRTARRRIRSYFGSSRAIAEVAVTVGARPTKRGTLFGFVLHLAGSSGVKGLRGSEGYALAEGGGTDPSCPVIHALRDLYLLQLEQVRVGLFIIPPESLDLSHQLVATTAPPDESMQLVLHKLLHGIDSLALYPCTKGRFFDGMDRKLDQLQHRGGNEITRFNCVRMGIVSSPDTESAEIY